MNDASLYQEANNVQRSDAKKIIDEFRDLIQWRSDGRDSLIDIGCGSGDVTIDFILPIMPLNFSKLVGVDISEKMIQHAVTNHQKPRVHFEVMDISSNLKNDFQFEFDHVTSFYCLHWVQNQKKALKNIYNLLSLRGDCLLVFLANNPIFDAYEKLAENTKWSPYMKDLSKFTAPFQHSEDPKVEFGELLREVGFSVQSVEVRDEIFIYKGTENLKKNVKAVSPFIERMTPNMQASFLEDYVEVVTKMRLREKMRNSSDYLFITPYKLIVAYAKK